MGTQAKQIGILGGTFDPIHFGHLITARDVAEYLELDHLFFIPAAQSPFKQQPPHATAQERLSVIRIAIEGEAQWGCLDLEIQAGGISYASDTAAALQQRWPQDRLYWIIGSDQLATLHRWHHIESLAATVTFVSVVRPGYPNHPDAEIPGLRLYPVRTHLIDICASQIRRRILAGASVRYLLPDKVIDYIQAHQLYRVRSHGL